MGAGELASCVGKIETMVHSEPPPHRYFFSFWSSKCYLEVQRKEIQLSGKSIRGVCMSSHIFGVYSWSMEHTHVTSVNGYELGVLVLCTHLSTHRGLLCT